MSQRSCKMKKGTKLLVLLLFGALLLRFGMFLGRTKNQPAVQSPVKSVTNTSAGVVEETSGRLVAIYRVGSLVSLYVIPDGQQAAISIDISPSDFRYDALSGVVTVAGHRFRYNEKRKDLSTTQSMKTIFGGPADENKTTPKATNPFPIL